MSDIQYKSPPKELCEGRTKLGAPCYNPAKERVNDQNLCGVHATPILRHKARYDTELTALEMWDRAGYGAWARSATGGELHSRLVEIGDSASDHMLSEARRVKLRAEEWAIKRELAQR